MSPDYDEQDRLLDEEFFGRNEESNDDALDNSTASENETVVTEPEDGTPEPVDKSEVNNEPVIAESRYKEAVRAMNEAQRELASYRKQDQEKDYLIQDLQRQLATRKETNQTHESTDLDALKDDYPEIVSPLLSVIDDLKKQLADVKGEVNGVKNVANRFQQNEATTAQEKHLADIQRVHPDALDLAVEPDFQAWLQQQAPMVQNAISQGSSRDVITALNLYRAENPKTESVPDTSKSDRLTAAKQAASPNVKSGGNPNKKVTYTHAMIAKMTDKEFAKHEAAIDEAMSRGEVF